MTGEQSSPELDAAVQTANAATEAADVRTADADARIADAQARTLDADAQTHHATTGMAAARAHMHAARMHMADAEARGRHAEQRMATADVQMASAARLITDMQQDSAEYDRAIVHYTQLVRHRMANPLQTICGMAETLRDHPDVSPDIRIEMISHIYEQAKVLERVSLEPRSHDASERELHPRPFDLAPPTKLHLADAGSGGFLAPIPARVPAAVDADRDWLATRAAMEQTIALTAEIVLQPSLYQCAQLVAEGVARIVGVQDAAFFGEGLYSQILVGDPPSDGVADGWFGVPVPNPFSVEPDAVQGTLWVRRPRDQVEATRVMGQLAAAARHVAAPMGSIAERKRLRAQLRTEHGLVDAGKALSQERTLEGVLQRIIELAGELVDARYGVLGVLDEAGDELAQLISVGMDATTRAAIAALPAGAGILGVPIDVGHPVRLADMDDESISAGFPPHHPPMTSLLGVPIISRGQLKGRIYLIEKRGTGGFTDEDERVVVSLASQAAIAIQTAELYEMSTGAARDLAGANTTLELADRHKSAFLTNMSHELRTPLNSVIGYATLLIDDSTNLSEEQLDDLRVIRTSGTHLLSLISDLLDLSKIEAGTLELRMADVDVAQLLRDTVTSLRPQVASTGVDLVVEAPDELIIGCDRSRVRQALLNVLSNAVKFTTDGSIYVTMGSSDDGGMRCEVHDTGPGIPGEDLDRIFEAFFQSGAALARTPRQSEGAGLGLAITRMLMRAHGGDVAVTSRFGEGTTVTMDLPAHAVQVTIVPGAPDG